VLYEILTKLDSPCEFPICGTPFGGFHRAGFSHPMKRVDFSGPVRKPWLPARRAYAPERIEEKPILVKKI